MNRTAFAIVFAIDKVRPGTSMLNGPVPTAVILWPWVVAFLAFFAIRFGVKSERIGWRHPAAVFLIFSALVWAPYKSVEDRFKANDPTWLSYYLSGY